MPLTEVVSTTIAPAAMTTGMPGHAEAASDTAARQKTIWKKVLILRRATSIPFGLLFRQ